MFANKNEQGNRKTKNQNNENFFWNLFLQTGRIDAYLLLKEEESEENNKPKT